MTFFVRVSEDPLLAEAHNVRNILISEKKYSHLTHSQDLNNLISATISVAKTLWNPPTSINRPDDRLRSIIRDQSITADVLLLFKTFSFLSLLVHPDIYCARRESGRSPTAEVWDGLPLCRFLLPMDVSFASFIHQGIEGGSPSPFLALYVSAYDESFDHRRMSFNLDSQGGSLQCM